MRPDARCRAATVAVAMAATLGCASDETPARARLLDSPAARRLVGAWDVTFSLDVATSATVRPATTPSVTGTLVFAEDRYGHTSSRELGEPTHDGAYDVDFGPFGFSSRAAGDVPVAVARVASASPHESLYVVLSPGTTRLAVQMTGTLDDDSATGEWRAAAFSAGGGAGHFTMHRRQATP